MTIELNLASKISKSKPLKLNKLSGFEEIRVNVIKQIYNDIKKVLVRISGESIKLGDFTLKIE